LVLLGLAFGAGGCGAHAELTREVRELRVQLDEIKRTQTAARVQIEELQSRIFVLQDEVQSFRTQVSRGGGGVPRLPVVRVESKPEVRITKTPATKRARPDAEPATEPETTYGDDPRSPRAQPPRRAVGGDVSRDEPPRSTRDEPPASADAVHLYQEGIALLKAGRAREARQRFETFAREFSTHALADNALYWLGETYYAESRWLDAVKAFREVVRAYPDGNKVPDAMLKSALCYQALGEARTARDVFRQVVELYPKSAAARIAAERLSESHSP